MSELACSGTLRLVDIAFSVRVSGGPIGQLAINVIKLERLNMRGSKNVAASCYNRISILGEASAEGRGRGFGLLERDKSLQNCLRKGDNLFYFCNKER